MESYPYPVKKSQRCINPNPGCQINKHHSHAMNLRLLLTSNPSSCVWSQGGTSKKNCRTIGQRILTRDHITGVFFTWKVNVTSASWEQCSQQQQSADAVTDFLPDTLQQSLTMLLKRPDTPKIRPSSLGIWTPSNTWFLGPTHVYPSMAISIASAVFAGLMNMTNRPTDRQTDRQTDGAVASRVLSTPGRLGQHRY